MVQWLKYFFGNFFNKKYAEQSAKRSYCNGLLSFLLAMILLLVLFATMAMAAFPAYYDNSQEFSAYYRGLFDGDNALSLSIVDGIATKAMLRSRKSEFPLSDSNHAVDSRLLTSEFVADVNDVQTVEFVLNK